MKKVLSLVLVIAMVLSSMSFAFASTFEDVTGDYEKAINTLAGLGVVTGYEDGTYRPEKVVTRAEMAKLIVEILGYGDLVTGSKSNFTDTQGHWADAWIALAAGKGLVVGTGDGKFTPDRTVSYDEAITMVVRALGYTDTCNELKNMTWPTNFKVKAAELKLTKDVKLASTGADRGGVAQLLYNALEAILVSVNSDGDVVKTEDKDGEYVQLLSRIATIDETTYRPVQPQHIDSEDKAYAGDIVDLAPYMYQNLTVYVNDDDEVVYVKSTEDLVVTGVVDEAADINKTDNTIRIEDANEKEYTFKVDANTELMINGVETSFADADKTLDAVAYSGEGPYVTVTLVLDADHDDKLKDGYTVDGIVTEIATAEVRASKDYVTGRTKINTIALPKDSDDEVELDKITVVGDASELEDIKEDAIVTAYAGKEADGTLVKIKLAVSFDTVEGKISKTNYDLTTVTIDGKAYNASTFYSLTDIEAGNEGTLFLNAEGYFHEFELESESTKDYAVVISASNGAYGLDKDIIDKDAKIKLATADDEEIIYTVADGFELNGVEIDIDGIIAALTAKADPFKGLVVEYDVDEDGKLEALDTVKFDKVYTDKTLDTDTKGFILADNAVIFDADTVDAYQVLTVDQLDDTIAGKVVYNDDGEIELLVVTDGAKASVGTYAVINNIEVTTNNDGDKVILVTAYVDGAKVSYMSDSDYYKNNIGETKTYKDVETLRKAVRGGFKLNELAMDGSEVTDITTVTTSSAITLDIDFVQGNVVSVKVANDVFTLADETVVALADDAIIYLQTDTAVVEVTDIADIDADSEATTTATEGDTIIAVDTDKDGEFDIVVIKER